MKRVSKKAAARRPAVDEPQTVIEPEVVRNLSVNYIPTSIDEFELREIFEKCGPIERLKIFMDRRTRSSHGHGFVQYRTAKGAVDAIKQLNGYSIGKKRLQVAYAKEAEAQQALTELRPWMERGKRLQNLCRTELRDFTPLGGNRPDAAVVACAAMELYRRRLRRKVIVAPDVLDTALGMLCAPLIINDARDLRDLRTLFRYPAVYLRVRTIDPSVIEIMHQMKPLECRLSLALQLDKSIEVLPFEFNKSLGAQFSDDWFYSSCGEWEPSDRISFVTHIDLRRTAIQRIGAYFMIICKDVTCVELPVSLTEVGMRFLLDVANLKHIDLRHTSIRRTDKSFMCCCEDLTSVELPETLTEVGDDFLTYAFSLKHIDLQRTSIQRIGSSFMCGCEELMRVELPACLTEVGDEFLEGCRKLECIDLSCTSIIRIGNSFLGLCTNVTSVELPDCISEVGIDFWNVVRS